MKKLIWLVIIILLSTISYSEIWNGLTKGQADQWYCKLTGCSLSSLTITGNLTVLGYIKNATIIQSNITDLENYYNKTVSDSRYIQNNTDNNYEIKGINVYSNAYRDPLGLTGIVMTSSQWYISGPRILHSDSTQNMNYCLDVASGDGLISSDVCMDLFGWNEDTAYTDEPRIRLRAGEANSGLMPNDDVFVVTGYGDVDANSYTKNNNPVNSTEELNKIYLQNNSDIKINAANITSNSSMVGFSFCTDGTIRWGMSC